MSITSQVSPTSYRFYSERSKITKILLQNSPESEKTAAFDVRCKLPLGVYYHKLINRKKYKHYPILLKIICKIKITEKIIL